MTCYACPNEGVIPLTVILDSENLALLEKEHGSNSEDERDGDVWRVVWQVEKPKVILKKKNPNGINKLEIA